MGTSGEVKITKCPTAYLCYGSPNHISHLSAEEQKALQDHYAHTEEVWKRRRFGSLFVPRGKKKK